MASSDEKYEDILDGTADDIYVSAYRPEEMSACPSCSRKNAPNRPKCLYCGAELAIRPDISLRLNDRRLETWEKGFNTIVTGGIVNGDLDAIAADFSLDPAITEALKTFPGPFPAQRSETRAEAEYFRKKLAAIGIESAVIADEDLQLNIAPVRLRALDIAGNSLHVRLFNSETERTVNADELAIVVTGTIFESKTRTTEKRSRRQSENLDESEESSREAVIDLYTKDDSIGFRVYPRGFDFSTLGVGKSLLAAENIKTLAEHLRRFVGDERYCDRYDKAREVLDAVWELERKRESLGLQKSGFGRPGLGRSATIGNADQFNRYSRMRRYLL